ncbi:hypothetical protein EQZ98_08485 [Leuconostoc mesenteroides]|uniref:hypothetical protein n=1 Tax=Leuconostoc mesenteroides TaxID=1245 RepID=UPI000DAB0C75|nr:hypothetical protein [Leuconostoc mesenteroides]AWV38450.1 hypothetical protein CD198_08140 [Leuconostoc mesenteroides]QAT28162.1 hypothetical protein EQZ98_08485 [Leuconostoc mesenteroides]
MKKLAWAIIFISLITVVSGLTALTLMYTDIMLDIYLNIGLYLLAVVILISIFWAIVEVQK